MSAVLKNPANRQRGSVALAALVALTVVFIIALGLLRLGSNARLRGKRDARLSAAQILASSGAEYGLWHVSYVDPTLPYTYSRSLGNGSFTVTATDNSANVPNSILVVSSGSASGDSSKVTTVMPLPDVFHYALCSNQSLSYGGQVQTGSGAGDGDIRVNGSLSLPASNASVNGNALATGTVSISSITGKIVPNAPAVVFPTIDTAHYQSIADSIQLGPINSGSITFQKPNQVVYVNGDLNLMGGTISGTGTIIVSGLLSGNVNISGKYQYNSSTDKMVILTTGNITCSNKSKVDGFYYAHNSSGNATISCDQVKFTNGGAAGDIFTFVSSKDSFVHDSTMNAAMEQQMHLPGY